MGPHSLTTQALLSSSWKGPTRERAPGLSGRGIGLGTGGGNQIEGNYIGPIWDEIYASVMGELALREFLAHLAGQEMTKAAVGQAGDRFTLLQGPVGERALAAVIAWDTPADAQEFFDAVTANTDISENVYVGINQDQVLLVLAPFQAVVNTIRDQFPGF